MNAMTLPVNELAGRGIGDNRPPLAEMLAEELAADKARADELLASAREARIETPADAGKVADLIVLVKEHERALDQEREKRKKPLLHDQRTIEAAYGAVIGPLARARTDVLTPLLNKWQQAHPDETPGASFASVGSRRKPALVIEDLPAVLAWLVENHPGQIAQSVRTIVGALVSHAGVDAVERGEVQIPGVNITVHKSVSVR